MAITIGGQSISVPNPVIDDGNFLGAFVSMFDQYAVVGVGSTKTVTTGGPGSAFQVYAWDTATGSVLTLPPANGTGMEVLVYVKTLATSNSHILYCNGANGGGGADVFIGVIPTARTDTGVVLGFAAASTSNTITLNRTTTGSVSKGEWIAAKDIASGIWLVRGMISATTAQATSFSHT